jgi:SHOCT domain
VKPLIKKSLLIGLSRVDDVARDVQLAKKLLTEGLITSEEYADLRKKILGIDH